MQYIEHYPPTYQNCREYNRGQCVGGPCDGEWQSVIISDWKKIDPEDYDWKLASVRHTLTSDGKRHKYQWNSDTRTWDYKGVSY